jgi:Family of unknown function (DUF5754)
MAVVLQKSPVSGKKWRVILEGKHVDFGAKGYEDYTMHKDHSRMLRYLMRHRKTENWSKAGRFTAGFWSRWLLWSKPSLKEAIQFIRRKFGFRLDRS